MPENKINRTRLVQMLNEAEKTIRFKVSFHDEEIIIKNALKLISKSSNSFVMAHKDAVKSSYLMRDSILGHQTGFLKTNVEGEYRDLNPIYVPAIPIYENLLRDRYILERYQAIQDKSLKK